MKKIRLNVANLDATEIHSRDQLKSIFGGSGSGSGSTSTCNWYSCWCKKSSSVVVLDTSKTLQADDAVEALKTMDCASSYTDTGCSYDKAC
jgi:hypothetical protein